MGSGTSKTKRPRLRIRKPFSDQDWRDWANEVHAGHMRATDMQNHRGQWITLRANTQAGVLEYFGGGEWRGLGYGAGGGGTASGGAQAGAGGGVDIPSHNLLPGLQGGAPWRGEYYHFQRAAHDELARFWDGGQWDLSNQYMADGHADTLHVRQRIGIGTGAEESPGYPLHVQETVDSGGLLGFLKNTSDAAGAFAAVAVEGSAANHGAALCYWSPAYAAVAAFQDHGGVYSGEAAQGLVVMSLAGPIEFWLYQGAYPAGAYTHVADVTSDGAYNGIIPSQDGQHVLGSEAAGLRWAAGSFDVVHASEVTGVGGSVTVNGGVTIIAGTGQLLLQEDNGQQFKVHDTATASQSAWDLDPLTVNATDAATIRFFRSVNTSGNRLIQIFKGDGSATSTMSFNAGIGDATFAGDVEVDGVLYMDQIGTVGNTLGLLTAPNAAYGIYNFDYVCPDGNPSIGCYVYDYIARATSANTAGSATSLQIRQLNRIDSGYNCTGWLRLLHLVQQFHATGITGSYTSAATLYINPIDSIGAAAGLTNNYGIYVEEPLGATNNYAIFVTGGSVRLGGPLSVVYSQPNVSIAGTSTGANAYAILSVGSEYGIDTSAGVRFHNDATGWHCGVHTDDSFAISHSYGGTMSSVVMSVTGYATSAVVKVDGRLVFGNNATSMENRSVGWNSTSGGMWMCGYGGVNLGSYRDASSAYDYVVRILGPWGSGVQAKMWPQYDTEVSLGDASHRWGAIFAALKSGTTQAGAGAATGELWVDTDDAYTVKMGV